ncbi:MAG: NAD(+)/NADH kinase [Candidatus Hydrothermarchaeaceae archaeon]
MIKKIGLVVKDLKGSLKTAREIQKYLASRNIETYFDDWNAKKVGFEDRGCRIEDFDTDLILTLGGDGAILKTVDLIAGKKIPILGINFGKMGFLTEIRQNEWKKALDRILDGKYTVEKRKKIEVLVDGKKAGNALNEAVVMTSEPVKILDLEVLVDGQTAELVRADGIIVSTPTGSTAYSMSAGGPIVDPDVSAFVITSICPFKLGVRSFVVPQRSTITVKAAAPKKETILIIDGEYNSNLKPKSEVLVRLSKESAYFIKLDDDFYRRIRERLQ